MTCRTALQFAGGRAARTDRRDMGVEVQTARPHGGVFAGLGIADRLAMVGVEYACAASFRGSPLRLHDDISARGGIAHRLAVPRVIGRDRAFHRAAAR